MGRAANISRNRKCKICAVTIRSVTAKELEAHARGCREDFEMTSRLGAIGLTRPKFSVEGAELLAKNRKAPPARGRWG